MCSCRQPGLDFASSLLKSNVEFLNVSVEEVPELVQKLCEALRVPAPADFGAECEPAAKKAKTGVDLEPPPGHSKKLTSTFRTQLFRLTMKTRESRCGGKGTARCRDRVPA
jgi:hypothetical protein